MTEPLDATLALDDLAWLRSLAAKLAAPGDADDLVQDTLIANWKNPPASADRPLRPWLATVLRNRARMQVRGRVRRERREQTDALTPALEHSPDDELDRVRILQAVFEALDELPELDRRIVVRRFLEGENATQIADRLGIPAATVRSRLSRALARMRASLDAQCGGRRDTWVLALAVPAPRRSAAGVLGGLAALAWSSCDSRSDEDESHAAAVAEPSKQLDETPEPSPRERWEQRRASVHAALLAARPNTDEGPTSAATEPGVDAAALEAARRDAVRRAGRGFSALNRACKADLESDASGAITLHAKVIGDPQTGTIFDSIEIVTETVHDPEVLACVEESMHAYVGDPPPLPIESQFTVTTTWAGRDEDDTRKERRIFDGIVGAHHGEVAACQRNAGFEGHGTLTLELMIGPERRALWSDVVRTDLPKPVVDCIAAASERWAFTTDLADKTFAYEFSLPVPGLSEMLARPDVRE